MPTLWLKKIDLWIGDAPGDGLKIALLIFFSLGAVLCLVYQVGLLMRTTLSENVRDLRQRQEDSGQLSQLEEIVVRTKGPILADEYMGLITLQGRPLVIQPLEVTQLSRAGVWDQTPLIQSILQKEFPLILIHYFPVYPVYKERWTSEMLAAIGRAYSAGDILAGTRIYQPINDNKP